MSPELWALTERAHGHLALLGLALLLHPVLTLRRPGLTARTLLTAELAAGMLTVAFLIGWWLYPTYREEVKPELLAAMPSVAARFETKEHLAAMCTALALAGAGALRLAGDRPDVRRTARALLLAAWGCGVIAGLLGLHVAGGAHPAW